MRPTLLLTTLLASGCAAYTAEASREVRQAEDDGFMVKECPPASHVSCNSDQE